MPRILVTGAAGFIGRRLVPALEAAGCTPTAYAGDVRAPVEASGAFDVVVHLAARTDGATPEQRAALYDVNVRGLGNVLDFCSERSARCVFVSSAGVYAKAPDATPLAETARLAPASAYALSKWLGERMCRRWCADAGGSAVVLRLFNVYGPGQREPFLIPSVLAALARGEAPPLRSPGAIRDFVHVDDVREALLLAVRREAEGFALCNIGTGVGASVAEAAELAASLLRGSAPLRSIETAGGEGGAVADVAHAEALLGWRARIDLRTGLDGLVRDAPEGR